MGDIKKTLVLGASGNPSRYSYFAINKLRQQGYEVFAIGKRQTTVGDVYVHTEHLCVENIHTVTLYLNAGNQKEYYDYIISLKPKRIIFNPGAENPELFEMCAAHGIQPLEACTLVLLATSQF